MKYNKIKQYIFNFKLTNIQKQELLTEHYCNNEKDRLEVFEIIYTFLQEDIIKHFNFDITEDDTFGEEINDLVNNLVLEYVF